MLIHQGTRRFYVSIFRETKSILFICVTSILLMYHQQPSYFLTFVQEMRHLDISHVRDIRTGKGVKVPKDPKLREMLSLGPGELEDKTVTVVYSTDFVNVNFVNFCTRKPDVAKVSVMGFFSILALGLVLCVRSFGQPK